MANKVYKIALGSNAFNFVMPSGISLSGASSLVLTIRKPDGTETSKILNGSNIVSGTNNISISVSSDMSDIEGIYDYNVINTTSGQYQIGPVLQYVVTLSIT